MLQSMTGFASGQGEADGFSWVWEIRSVNAKGLDLRLRVPDWIEGLEAELRKIAAAQLRRGNVTINLRLTRAEGGSGQKLNAAHLDTVLDALAEIEHQAMARGVSLGPSTSTGIIALRGILEQEETPTDSAALRAILIEDFQPVMASFCEMRSREGSALFTVLNSHLDQIETLVTQADTTAEARKPKARETLKTALAQVLDAAADVDEARLTQELALLAIKSDITEEIKRLQAHVNAAREQLTRQESVGRKMDFLMQEFNREANTLCSKSGDSDLTSVGLDLKAVIDQMREQVQNVE
ncbi:MULTISPECIES: YicC/YloC family endoribonuclease [unclassified Marinovum]|uniref:YicC/YloC family endoribonuclease n=1 Tax=unclassified Marinovum TaxID=2647166 RepID=UPI0026E2EAA2|nr:MULTISPECIES: YicC/YloC family endoribonuclease [unclassified Marinovum]